MRRIHAGRQLELLLHPLAESLAFRGEEQDLQEMLGNLLDNASARQRLQVGYRPRRDSGQRRWRKPDDPRGR